MDTNFTRWMKKAGTVYIILIHVVVVFLLVTCKSFSPVQIQGEFPECNDMYSAMRMVIVMGGKDTGIITTAMAKCHEVRTLKRKDARKETCKKQVYGEQPLDRNDYKKYSDYSDCIKE